MSTAEAARPSAATGGDGLFTRQASGLVREIGIPAAVGMSLGAVACINLLIAFPGFTAAFSKVDFYIPILAAGVFWLIAMLAYRHLVQAIPRAGGEYVYVSRVISPIAGALAGIATALILVFTVAANVDVAALFTPFMLTSIGSALDSSAISNAAEHVTSQFAIALISVGIMLAVGAAVLLSLKRLAQIVFAMVVIQLLAFLVLAFLLATHSHADFVNSFDKYSENTGAYNSLLQLGRTNGVEYGVAVAPMLALFPLGVLAYSGVLYSYYLGGELRKPGRTFVYASAIGIGILMLVWLGIWMLLRHTAGLHFMQAQANVSSIDPAAYEHVTGLESGIGPLGYGLVLSGDPISKILIGVAVPVASVAVALAITAISARVLLALAFDRMLPVSVAKVSERNHVPFVAIAIVTTVAIGFCVLLSYANVTALLSLLALFLILVVFAGGTAATFLAFRRPDLVMRPGETDVRRWLGVPQSTWFGGATVALAVFAIIEILVHRSVYLVINAQSIISLVVVLLAGPVVYAVANTVRRQRSAIDLGMAMRELPPE
jgi:basic amino acid/polyamine antiporter, APA family